MKYAIIAAILIAGCAQISKLQDQIAAGVTTYCTRPLIERQTLRETINAKTAPNSIKVNCAGDPQSGS